MDLMEAIRQRHSVRRYKDGKIEGAVLERLEQAVSDRNRESGLHIQLCLDEPRAFSGMMARYGRFDNVRNYVALIGPKTDALEEKCGYHGEKLALEAQMLGLNTCWVAASYSKGKTAAGIEPGEKLLMVLAIGYGETPGVPHKSKPLEDLCRVAGAMPDWFRRGVEAAALAPTAMNQQKFCFSLSGNTVSATAGSGFYTKTDLGIAKCHFEIGAGADGWVWAPR
jgi:nitroreductase